MLLLVALVAAGAFVNSASTAHAAGPVVLAAAGSDTTQDIMDTVLDPAQQQYNIHAQQSPALTVPGDTNCPQVVYSTPHTVANVVFASSTTLTIASGKQTPTNLFKASDVGNIITTGNPAEITNGTTVASFVNPSTVTLSAATLITNANKSVTIATVPGSFNSPNGSSAGRRALRDSVGGVYPTSSIGAGKGCVDIARSSADPGTPPLTDTSGRQYYAFALDVVNWASPSLNAPASMTLQNLRDIYACKITQWNELPGGGTGQIQRMLAQANSGTEATFLNKVLGGVLESTVIGQANQDPTPGSACPAPIQTEENHGNYLTDPAQGGTPALYQQMILPYSNGKWVFQATNAANPTLDIRNGVRVGAITNIPTDATSAVYGVRWSGSQFFLNSGGPGSSVARALVATDGVTTSGSTTVTSATANFKTADAGLTISGTGIPAGTTIASVTNGTTVVLSGAATASGTGVSLTLSGAVASEVNPNVTDSTEARIFPGVRYLYNVIDTGSPNFADAQAVVGFDINTAAKSPLCSANNFSDILSAGFVDLPAKNIGSNTGVTCRVS